ncbi:MAG: hypothetical protein ACLFQK_01300 [Fibrobacterota bacterium]
MAAVRKNRRKKRKTKNIRRVRSDNIGKGFSLPSASFTVIVLAMLLFGKDMGRETKKWIEEIGSRPPEPAKTIVEVKKEDSTSLQNVDHKQNNGDEENKIFKDRIIAVTGFGNVFDIMLSGKIIHHQVGAADTVPLVSGINLKHKKTGDFIDSAELKKLKEVLTVIRNTHLENELSEVMIEEGTGFSIYTNGGTMVRMDINNVEEAISNYSIMKIKMPEKLQTAGVLDLRFRNTAYLRN